MESILELLVDFLKSRNCRFECVYLIKWFYKSASGICIYSHQISLSLRHGWKLYLFNNYLLSTQFFLVDFKGGSMRFYKHVSHPCQIKHKTLFLKIELNAFSNRGHIYGHFEKKNSNISKINEMVRKINQL